MHESDDAESPGAEDKKAKEARLRRRRSMQEEVRTQREARKARGRRFSEEHIHRRLNELEVMGVVKDQQDDEKRSEMDAEQQRKRVLEEARVRARIKADRTGAPQPPAKAAEAPRGYRAHMRRSSLDAADNRVLPLLSAAPGTCAASIYAKKEVPPTLGRRATHMKLAGDLLIDMGAVGKHGKRGAGLVMAALPRHKDAADAGPPMHDREGHHV
eukprot:CAMPEP_0173431718 /NCGR_PEP_ID=MMETSP1357-20121228/9766_1 /TAXON_ID=77926 /ORGANISM="Hemiselmis rufescens, Strain PCC563" /LENGTH=213 /DNA_ID=CAMNT_0014396223 /DNA_START=112 /DNA_END=753 /DNA_ORIENTATION=+